MKLPLASKYILSKLNDGYYLCCFCNGFNKTIKYVTADLEDFYDTKCSYCEYEEKECDAGIGALLDEDCFKYKYSDFTNEEYFNINVPNHIYIEIYEYDDELEYSASKLLILVDNKLKPLRIANTYDYGDICFGDATANTPALRYSNYWNSEFNNDLTHDNLIEDRDDLREYLTNWTIEKQEFIYGVKNYELEDFINEENYIESDIATDIIFAKDILTNKNYIGLGTNTHNRLSIEYLK